LEPGEKITIENLLYGMLIHSGNDAAFALAKADSGNIDDFVKKMNKKAEVLGLKNTHFTNPIGLDDKDAYSTAYDLYLLSKFAYSNNFIKNAVKQTKKEIASSNHKIVHELENTNQLLKSYLDVEGLKTGTTDEAKQCLITIAKNKKGNKIITIILGSDDRFGESKILIDWTFRSYTF
jgi:serine-type D-Ala-D-Ala carboxypeptidase (penicillin-binding protein 5/6)